MIKLTRSFAIFLMKFHKDIYVPLTFGHIEGYTEEIQAEYYKWLETDDGKSYLKGGSNYKESEDK